MTAASPVKATLAQDFRAAVAMDPTRPTGLARTLDVLTQPGFLAVVLYRFAAALHGRGLRIPARLLMLASTMVVGAEIYPGARIGPGLTIAHPVGVAIGAGVTMGRDVRLHGMVRLGVAGRRSGDGWPDIGDGCVLFDGCRVFGPVCVGAGSTIGAQVLLMHSVPAGSVVVAPEGVLLADAARQGDLR